MPSKARVIFFSSLGGVLEFYDFIIYALLATYISHHFFPTDNDSLSLIMTFASFAIGYLARPLGGLFFGHIGDKKGRKKPFTATVLMMALSTFLIGCLPTYEQVGIVAPLSVLLLRIIQGFSVGGEIPGGITYLSEIAPKSRATVCSLLFTCLMGGIVLGFASIMVLHQVFSEEQMQAFAWRIPFMLGGILGLLSFLMRRSLIESPVYTQMLKEKQQSENKVPVWALLSEHRRLTLAGFLITAAGASAIMVFALILPSFLSKIHHYPMAEIIRTNTLCLFITIVFITVIGWLVDRLNIRYQWFAPICVLAALASTVSYHLYAQQTLPLIVPILLGSLPLALIYSFLPTILSQLFPAEIRYSGIALTYNLAFATVGGLAPMTIFALVAYTGSTQSPATYQAIASLLGVIGILLVRKQLSADTDQQRMPEMN